MFSLSRNNITSLSPFAVMDKEALGVSNNNAANKDLNVYPNPAGNALYFSSVYHFDRAAIYNTAGTLIKSETLSGNSISLQSLPAGSYFVHLTDGNTTAVKQITKL
jgi:hypothetical protein